MPIDRSDGRHWCAPDRETHGLDHWACPGCNTSWELHGNVWWREGEYIEPAADVAPPGIVERVEVLETEVGGLKADVAPMRSRLAAVEMLSGVAADEVI